MRELDDRVVARKLRMYIEGGSTVFEACYFIKEDFERFTPTLKCLFSAVLNSDMAMREFIDQTLANPPPPKIAA